MTLGAPMLGRVALLATLILGVGALALLAGPATARFVGTHQATWHALVARHPIAAAAMFVLAYGGAVTVMLPVGLVLTVASGVLFGAVRGALLSILGALTGALTAYLLTRSLGLSWTGRPTLSELSPANSKGRTAFAVVLALRLAPLTPFTPVSVAAGLARMPLPSFLLATCLGVAPESAVYSAVGAGAVHVLGPMHWLLALRL